MSSGNIDRNDPESGWRLDVVPSFLPPRLFGGEHLLSVFGVYPAVFFAVIVAPRVPGTFFHVPWMLIVIAGSVVFYLLWLAIIYKMWGIDPWLSRTLLRFLSHPLYFPAHSTGAVAHVRRTTLRAKGFKRR